MGVKLNREKLEVVESLKYLTDTREVNRKVKLDVNSTMNEK